MIVTECDWHTYLIAISLQVLIGAVRKALDMLEFIRSFVAISLFSMWQAFLGATGLHLLEEDLVPCKVRHVRHVSALTSVNYVFYWFCYVEFWALNSVGISMYLKSGAPLPSGVVWSFSCFGPEARHQVASGTRRWLFPQCGRWIDFTELAQFFTENVWKCANWLIDRVLQPWSWGMFWGQNIHQKGHCLFLSKNLWRF